MPRFMDQTGLKVALILICITCASCAPIRLPAIDPTGNRIFSGGTTTLLTPNLVRNQNRQGLTNPLNQPAPFGPANSAFPETPLSTGPVLPAFQQPGPVPPCPSSGQCLFRTRNNKYVIPNPNGFKTDGNKGQIIMTPHRIIAPVGSEVVVIAGICGEQGRFLLNQPLEWILSNDSVGQFVDVGGRHHEMFNRLIPPTARKIDGSFAHGRTGLKEAILSRGTPTPTDDIQLLKGQTFVSVSSESAGTSYVTGLAPNADAWDKRRTSTIIHWVDGVWSIPVPTTATAGTVHPLTTVVSRSSTGGGVKGWKVRYTILGGAPAEFAPTGSKTAEAITDENGQATVQLRQLAGQFDPGTTRVRVDVIRPEVYGEPELLVESGMTSVAWSAPALTIKAIGPESAGVQEAFNYRIQVTNPGDQVARDVVVRTRDFDDNLEFISSTPKSKQFGREFEWNLGNINPGSPARIIDVQVKANEQGNVGVCFEVQSQQDGLKTEACAQTEISIPCLALKIEGPQTAKVGQEVEFRFTILNQCQESLKNIRLELLHDSGLSIRSPEGRILSNPVQQTIDAIPFNETRSIGIKMLVNQPGTRCFDLSISADGGHTARARECIDAVAADRSNVELNVLAPGAVQVGDAATVEIAIKNNGTLPLNGLTLTNRFSPSLTEKNITDKYRDKVTKIADNELAIPIPQLLPGQQEILQLQYSTQQVDGNARVNFSISNPSGDVSEGKGATIRIEPGSGQPNDGGGIGIPPDSGTNGQGLDVAISAVPNSAPLNSTVTFNFSVTNRRQVSDRNLRVEVLIPNDLRFDQYAMLQNDNLKIQTVAPGRYVFDTIREIRPGEKLDFAIQTTTLRAGSPIVGVQASSELNPIGNSTTATVNVR